MKCWFPHFEGRKADVAFYFICFFREQQETTGLVGCGTIMFLWQKNLDFVLTHSCFQEMSKFPHENCCCDCTVDGRETAMEALDLPRDCME
jgi:hypothetical protein